jgi:RNA polymerase sigma-70 factor (ECF subfamily)
MSEFALAAGSEFWAPAGTPSLEETTLDQGRAMEDFLADVERRAFCIARSATGSADDALDIVQDTMMRLVRRYSDRPSDQWAPLFYRILRNRITDHQRSQAVKRRLFGWLDTGTEDVGDPMDMVADRATPGPDRQSHNDDAMAGLETALAELPERQRQAFTLRALEGLDVKGTALAMGCSVGSVKTHYFRAVRALRAALEDFEP